MDREERATPMGMLPGASEAEGEPGRAGEAEAARLERGANPGSRGSTGSRCCCGP
jgi:hypothetical protein